MIFSPSSIPNTEQYSIKIGNNTIERYGNNKENDSLKFLGITLDESLTWKQHISATSSKISRAIYAINRAKNFLPHNALKTLYISLVQSQIQYGIEAWGNATTQIKHLLTLQKRAIRVINNKRYRSHTDPLFKNNQLLKVQDIYKVQTCTFMHNYVHARNKLPTSFDNFFPAMRENILTRQKFDILRSKAHTAFSDKLTKHSLPTLWNSLDNKQKEITTKSTFKRIIKTQIFESYLAEVNCKNTGCTECHRKT